MSFSIVVHDNNGAWCPGILFRCGSPGVFGCDKIILQRCEYDGEPEPKTSKCKQVVLQMEEIDLCNTCFARMDAIKEKLTVSLPVEIIEKILVYTFYNENHIPNVHSSGTFGHFPAWLNRDAALRAINDACDD